MFNHQKQNTDDYINMFLPATLAGWTGGRCGMQEDVGCGVGLDGGRTSEYIEGERMRKYGVYLALP